MFKQSIEVAAGPVALFDLTQDYSRRLDWDPFLREARLVDGAERPGVGVRAWCVARGGLGMETRYVSFNPPGACAVEMTRGPWFFRSFSGSWRFDPIGPDRTRVTFTYSLVGRPGLLTGPLRLVFAAETRRRLAALKRFVEAAVRPA
jgi:ribosome-associated toxin RatA of RatAB toxin-antitoxin module